jgi:sulfur-carrier protein
MARMSGANITPMARVVFTANLQRHVDCPQAESEGSTVREALESVFRSNERLRGYVLDDQSALRRHMAVVVDGKPLRDRVRLSDPVSPASAIYVLQALSGG